MKLVSHLLSMGEYREKSIGQLFSSRHEAFRIGVFEDEGFFRLMMQDDFSFAPTSPSSRESLKN